MLEKIKKNKRRERRFQLKLKHDHRFIFTCFRLYVENFNVLQCMQVVALSSGTQQAATAPEPRRSSSLTGIHEANQNIR